MALILISKMCILPVKDDTDDHEDHEYHDNHEDQDDIGDSRASWTVRMWGP